MPIATTQSDFRNHIKDYLDKVNDENQIVLIARSINEQQLLSHKNNSIPFLRLLMLKKIH